jgi:hypothetical protein
VVRIIQPPGGTPDNDSVTNAVLADMATSRLKGRVTAGTGDPEDLTGTQATTLLDTVTSALKGLAPASGGGTSNFLRADGTWAAPSGGASYEHVLDIPPGSAHAKDDEFTGSALDAKWTNPLSSGSGLDLTLSVANGWLRFEPATAGTASTGKRGGFGIRQSAPTGAFTIAARILPMGPTAVDDSRAGIFVARTATTQAHVLGYQSSQQRTANVIGCAGYSESAEWGGYDGFDQYTAATQQRLTTGFWYKIGWSGTDTLTFHYSTTGFEWHVLHTLTGQAQPDRIGLAIYANTADIRADNALAVAWFRVTEP